MHLVIIDFSIIVSPHEIKLCFIFCYLDGCGTCMNMTNEGGTIESINFPDEYNSNMNCNFTIVAPSGIKIKLSFQEFVVENCCDFITVSIKLMRILKCFVFSYIFILTGV